MLNIKRNLKEYVMNVARNSWVYYTYNKPPKKSDVVFDCTLASFSTKIIHKKKRQLKGSVREKIAGELL